MALQVRRDNWKYQSGLLPESQGASAIQTGSALHAARLCLRFPMRVALPCRPVAVCRKGLLGDEQAAHFPLENGVRVGNGSERRLRRGRSRPRGLVVTVSGDGAVFSMSASFGPPYSEHDP